MAGEKKLIFLFSLPRSGSTLLQKLIATHSKIDTLSETWIFLPFGFVFEENEVLSTYSHTTCRQAIEQFVANLDEKDDAFHEEFGVFIKSLLDRSEGVKTANHFLEKTPRNYLIIDFIHKVFPDSKFIFLFRNPVGITQSIIDTWGNSSLRHLHRHQVDLKSFDTLYSGYLKYSEKSIALHYEDLIHSKEEQLETIFNFLDLPFNLNDFRSFDGGQFIGKKGDQKGVRLNVVKNPDESIRYYTLARKIVLRKVINRISDSFFNQAPYTREILYQQTSRTDWNPFRNVLDILQLMVSWVITKFHLNVLLKDSYRNKYFD